jgi:hypothetical protein
MMVLMGIGVMVMWAIVLDNIITLVMHNFSAAPQSASLGLAVVDI